MPPFAYTARTLTGGFVEGTLQASDRGSAIICIEQQIGIPITIQQTANSSAVGTKRAAHEQSPLPEVQRLPLSQLFLFTEQLAHLLSAGMTLDESLGILVKRLESPRLKALARALHQALVDGRSLSQALRDFPKIFSPLYINMVAAGEVSGALPQILRRLVTHIADIKSLRDRVQQALIYPSALVAVGLGLIVIFMTVMVPQLTKFLKTTGQALPAATQALIGANTLLTHYWWAGALFFASLFAAWKIGTRPPEGRCAWDRAMWHLPALSRIPRYRFYAQFARTLATLSENGVTLLKSLELLEEISGNEWVRRRMAETRRAVTDGASLSNALRRDALFPPLFLDMMAVGEQTGRFAETMAMIAEVHERELAKQVQFVSTLVPLLVIVVIALLVGLMVYAILSAVFGLTSGLQGRLH
jgi:type II secretory pathway component PulF